MAALKRKKVDTEEIGEPKLSAKADKKEEKSEIPPLRPPAVVGVGKRKIKF